MILKKFLVLPVMLLALNILTAAPKKPADPVKGFAVIELFTSEGCSSCPPADELVARVQRQYKDQPVYILAFHVDYWNRLGWRDVFSNEAYSARQSAYAKYLKLPQVYTPQIVVNGQKEFVGSEEGNLRNAIKAGLQKPAAGSLALSNVKAGQGQLSLHYQAEGNGNILILALVEKTAQSQVKAGENKGRNLSHVQIIRQMESVQLKNAQSGNTTIALPKDFDAKNWEIIGLVQSTTTGEIIAATKQQFTLAS